MKNHFWSVFAPFLIVLFVSSSAGAFKFAPIEMSLAPAGRDSTKTFEITNSNDKPIAVEIRVATRRMTLMGDDVLEDAEELFIIFPAQVIVMPGQIQSVRVQWAGDPTPDHELAFRLIAEQLPIDLTPNPDGGAQVRILVRYIASLYVAPPGVAADLSLASAKRETGPDGTTRLLVVLENRGSAHALLRGLSLSVTGRGQNGLDATVTLTTEQLDGMTGQNLLAGARRAFQLPWPPELADGPFAVTFDYQR